MSDKMPKYPEMRHYQRVDMELPVRLEVDGRIIESTTENISCGGMFMPTNTSSPLNEKDLLTAFITLPDAPQKEVRLTGKICRIQKNKDNAVSGLAIQFNGLFDDNHLELDRLIKWKKDILN